MAAVVALAMPFAANALSLGELRLQSYLGEPLRAEIPVSVPAGARLDATCVQLLTDPGSGLAQRYDARLSTRGGMLYLEGRQPLREPLMTLTVRVQCPGVSRFERDYLVMPDPRERGVADRDSGIADLSLPGGGSVHPAARAAADAPATRPAPSAVRSSTPAPSSAPSSTTPRRTPATATRAPQTDGIAGTYTVRPGDTLYGIARAVDGRSPGSLGAQMDAILAANPQAFIDGNADRLRAGVTLEIPRLAGAISTVASGSTAATPAVQARQPLLEITLPLAALRPPPLTLEALDAADARAAQRQADAAPAQAALSPVVTDATTTPPVSLPAEAQAGSAGLARWLGGLLVGFGFLSMALLLAWTSLRSRRVARPADASLLETGRARNLAPPPSFDPELAAGLTGSYEVHEARRRRDDTDSTDEVPVLADAGSADGADSEHIDLDALFPEDAASDAPRSGDGAPGATPDTHGDDAAADEAATDDDVMLDPAAMSATMERFGLTDPGRPRGGDTTVEHQFSGFTEADVLDSQMAQAMAMLEADYTSRFTQARSLDDTGNIEATDTLHGLPPAAAQAAQQAAQNADVDAHDDRGGDDVHEDPHNDLLDDLGADGASAVAAAPATASADAGEADTRDADSIHSEQTMALNLEDMPFYEPGAPGEDAASADDDADWDEDAATAIAPPRAGPQHGGGAAPAADGDAGAPPDAPETATDATGITSALDLSELGLSSDDLPGEQTAMFEIERPAEDATRASRGEDTTIEQPRPDRVGADGRDDDDEDLPPASASGGR